MAVDPLHAATRRRSNENGVPDGNGIDRSPRFAFGLLTIKANGLGSRKILDKRSDSSADPQTPSAERRSDYTVYCVTGEFLLAGRNPLHRKVHPAVFQPDINGAGCILLG
jgi:hypothetical protein